MRIDEMKDALDLFVAAEARRDAAAVAAIFAEDGVYEDFALDLRFAGREAVQLLYEGRYQGTPDMTLAYRAEIVVHDVVAKLAIVSGSVKEQFIGVPASGLVQFPSLSVIRFAKGAIAHVGVHYDLEDLCGQLRISPDDVRTNLTDLRAVVSEGQSTAQPSA